MARFLKLFRKRSDEVECHEIHDLASAYVDNELKEPVLVKVQRHLSFCPPCQSFLASFGRTVGLMHDMPQDRCPDDLRRRILEKTKKD